MKYKPETICVIVGWALLVGGLMMQWHLPGLMMGVGVVLLATFGGLEITHKPPST